MSTTSPPLYTLDYDTAVALTNHARGDEYLEALARAGDGVVEP